MTPLIGTWKMVDIPFRLRIINHEENIKCCSGESEEYMSRFNDIHGYFIWYDFIQQDLGLPAIYGVSESGLLNQDYEEFKKGQIAFSVFADDKCETVKLIVFQDE